MAAHTCTLAATPDQKHHVIGGFVSVAASFKVGATATDPTAVTVMLRDPDGTEASFVEGVDAECVQDSTGEFHFLALFTAAKGPGLYYVRWKGTGTVGAAAETELLVDPSTFVAP